MKTIVMTGATPVGVQILAGRLLEALGLHCILGRRQFARQANTA
jgi:hypothetical protein